jgi:hypothetical protein
MKNQLEAILRAIYTKNPRKAKKYIEAVLYSKIPARVRAEKKRVAKQFFKESADKEIVK